MFLFILFTRSSVMYMYCAVNFYKELVHFLNMLYFMLFKKNCMWVMILMVGLRER